MTPADLIAQTLERMHFDGTGCGDPKSSGACSNCAGPSPMTAREVAQAVTEALGLVEEWGAQFDDMDEHTGRGVLVRPSRAAAARSLIDPTDALVTRYVTPWTKEQTDDRR